MIAPWRRVVKLDTPKIKIVFGKGRRKNVIIKLMVKFKINKKYYDYIDACVRSQVKIY